ncbi:hypothetical protein [Rubritepida flocculans]|uniref:hypothetical protein n=1 Tax=Rubritepida flocculans TaxID=182403 RepID=UPI00040D86C8|nr:hypothetical protein [Rubritepida flocculans]
MSGVLALGPEPRPVAWDPIPTAPRGLAERFMLGLEAQLATGNFASEERNARRAFAEAQAVLAEAGERVENPYEAGRWTGDTLRDIPRALNWLIPPTPDRLVMGPTRFEQLASPEERRRREEAWDAAVARLRAARPDEADRFPTVAELRDRARRNAIEAEAEARRAEDLGGGLGDFAGRVAGVFADPIQLLTLPLGFHSAGGSVLRQVARVAAQEAAIAAGTQAVVELRAGPYRVSLGLPDDSLEQIGMAALGGAVIGGGVRAVLAGVERVLARAPQDSPARIQAEGARPVAETQAMAEAVLPAPEQALAHEQAAAAAQAALLARQRPAASLPGPNRRVLAGWIEQPAAGDERQAIADFVARALRAPEGRVHGVAGGWLEEAEARALRELGLPVGTETPRVLTSDAVRHVWRRHGPDAARAPDEPPITLHDLAGWQGFIAAAQQRALTLTDPRGAQPGRLAVAYLARDARGGMVVVEEYRAGNGMLALATMYRLPEGSGVTRLEQVPGMAERMRRAAASPPMHDAGRQPGPPVLTSQTLGGLADNLPPALGRFNAYAPTGRAVLVEPRVVSLRQLVPSHDPEGRPNPAYPHAEGLQPRDRAAAPSQDQVRAIAARLIPERLLPSPEAGAGAPIIGPDLVVESGNGRIAALTLVHRDPALAAQREAYLAALRRAGFDIEGVEEPVLVSARVSQLSAAERAAFVREANLRATLAEPAAEVAKRDVAAVRDALRLWRGGDLRHAANQEFREAFVARLTPEERGALLRADGSWNAELIQRLERALLMAAYGDAFGPLAARLVEGETEGIRGLAAALRQVAGDWAAMRAEAARSPETAHYDGTPALAEAVDAILEAQRRKLRVADLVLQADLERPPITDSGMGVLKSMFPDGDLARRIKPEVRLVEVLRGYVARAQQAEGGPTLLDLPPVRVSDLAEAARRAEEADAALGPREVAADEPLTDPQAARVLAAEAERARLAALPETARAELLEAQRIAAARDIPVPEEAGEIGARALLEAAEREAEELAAAAACLIGGAP